MFLSPKKVKNKNTQLLSTMGISILESLPHLDKPHFRKSEEVASRAIVLAALLQLHFGAPNDFIRDYLKANELLDSMTPGEKERLSKNYSEWSEQDKINLDWSMDAIWALMWCGGKHNDLSFNTAVGDTLASMTPAFHENEPALHRISDFRLIDLKTIFTELDKFYRVHWFARNNSLSGINDNRVNQSMIMERRKALEWVCDSRVEWDDISLDT